MTRAMIEHYRRMRKRWMRYGRNAFSPEEWALYQETREALAEWIRGLPEPAQRSVAYWYYLHGHGTAAVSLRVSYSERQVRRIRRSILALLDEE